MEITINKSTVWGVVGGLLLLVFYFIVLTLANSFTHAVEQLLALWYWILALLVGFSIQAGLYAHIRGITRERKIKGLKGEVAAVGGISTGSMVACCAHHLVDVLPILGLSAAFLFLANYQLFFIILGIVSNIIGIIFILEIIKKYSLYKIGGNLHRFVRFDIRVLKYWSLAGAGAILFAAFFWGGKGGIQDSALAEELPPSSRNSLAVSQYSLPARINSAGNLTVEVEPIDFTFNRPLELAVAFNTHEGNLNFNLLRQSFLIDDQGNKYPPLEWQGGSGGHHLKGKLIFSPLTEKIKTLKFVINNVYGIKERIFEWNLK